MDGTGSEKQDMIGAGCDVKVSEFTDAGQDRKSPRVEQGRFRILRRQSELSAKLGNQHILDVGKSRRTAQV